MSCTLADIFIFSMFANQWTGFYMITISVMKELKVLDLFLVRIIIFKFLLLKYLRSQMAFFQSYLIFPSANISISMFPEKRSLRYESGFS